MDPLFFIPSDANTQESLVEFESTVLYLHVCKNLAAARVHINFQILSLVFVSGYKHGRPFSIS